MNPRAVPAFPGYRVWPTGRVDSRRNSRGLMRWRRLKPRPDRKGYLRVALWRDGRVFDRKVHHLVLEAFVGPCPEGMEGCHFPDPNPANNRVENLRWDTRKANLEDAQHWGEGHYAAKLTEAAVRRIRQAAATGMSDASLATIFGVHRGTVYKIRTGVKWRHVV